MQNQATVAITGNTYPVKDQLKSLGARWNPDQKVWMIADEKAAEARKIVSGTPITAQSNYEATRYYRGRKLGGQARHDAATFYED